MKRELGPTQRRGRDGYGFAVRTLRRLAEVDPEIGAEASYRIGVRICRLMADAPAGSTIELRSRARGDGLSVEVRVLADSQMLDHPGFANGEAVPEHLASEVRGLLADFASPGVVTVVTAADDQADLARLEVVPRGSLGASPLGLVAVSQHAEGGQWAAPARSDWAELSRLLLSHPQVALVQTVTSLPAKAVESARRDLAMTLPLSAVGTPIGPEGREGPTAASPSPTLAAPCARQRHAAQPTAVAPAAAGSQLLARVPSLGAARPTVLVHDLTPGDRITSDGVHDTLAPEHLALEAKCTDAQVAAGRITAAAVAHGSRDNVTAIIATYDPLRERGGATWMTAM